MKARIMLIIALITISLCGIIYSQISWLNKVYDLEAKDLSVKLNEAFESALKAHQDDQIQGFFRQLQPLFIKKFDTIALGYNETNGFAEIKLVNARNWNPKKPPLKNDTLRMDGVNLIVNRFGTERDDIRKVSIAVDSLVRGFNTNNRTIYSQTDSSSIMKHFKNELSKLGFKRLSHIQLVFFSSRSTLDFSTKRLPAPATMVHRYFTLRSPGSLDERWVGAYLHNGKRAAFMNIMPSIGFSLLFSITTIGAYLFMLHTIMKQKKLALIKEDFIHNVTHEFKTPLSTLSAVVERLETKLKDQNQVLEYVKTAKTEIRRLDDLVGQVLNISLSENSDVSFVPGLVVIDEIINDAIDECKAYSGRPVSIIYSNKSQYKYLRADEYHFRNVIMNLLDNAIKFSPEAVEIVIEVRAIKNYLQFYFRDQGLGIPEGESGLIFNKFYRVKSEKHRFVKGTGLGLSYVKQVIEKHGGTVTVKSELNKGTEFVLSLPISDGE